MAEWKNEPGRIGLDPWGALLPSAPTDRRRSVSAVASPAIDDRPVALRNSPRTAESVPMAARTIDLAELDSSELPDVEVAPPAPIEHVDAVRSRLRGRTRSASEVVLDEPPAPMSIADTMPIEVGPGAMMVYVVAFVGGLALGTLSLMLVGTTMGFHAGAPIAPTPTVAAPSVQASASLRGPSIEGLVNEGFALLDTRPAAASDRFRAALEQQPDHPAALLGLGQSLLVDGRVEDGRRMVCRVVYNQGAIGSTARSVLESYGLGCGAP